MDLTLPVKDMFLNVRVAVILKTENGFVLEKSKNFDGYFAVGGRMKINETSEEAAKREVLEEVGLVIKENLKLKAIIELFFGYEKERVHEICFVYILDGIHELKLSEGFGEYTIEQINNMDVRPLVIKQLFESKSDEFVHLTHRE